MVKIDVAGGGGGGEGENRGERGDSARNGYFLRQKFYKLRHIKG